MLKKELVVGHARLERHEFLLGVIKEIDTITIKVPMRTYYSTSLGIEMADFLDLSIGASQRAALEAFSLQPSASSLVDALVAAVPGIEPAELERAVFDAKHRSLRTLVQKFSTTISDEVVASGSITASAVRTAFGQATQILEDAANSNDYVAFLAQSNARIGDNPVLSALFAYASFMSKKTEQVVDVATSRLISTMLPGTTALDFFSRSYGMIPDTTIVSTHAASSVELDEVTASAELSSMLLKFDADLLAYGFGSSAIMNILTYDSGVSFDELLTDRRTSSLKRADFGTISFGAAQLTDASSAVEEILAVVAFLRVLANLDTFRQDIKPEQLEIREMIGTQAFQLRILGTAVRGAIEVSREYLSLRKQFLSAVTKPMRDLVTPQSHVDPMILFARFAAASRRPFGFGDDVYAALGARWETLWKRTPTIYPGWVTPLLETKAIEYGSLPAKDSVSSMMFSPTVALAALNSSWVSSHVGTFYRSGRYRPVATLDLPDSQLFLTQYPGRGDWTPPITMNGGMAFSAPYPLIFIHPDEVGRQIRKEMADDPFFSAAEAFSLCVPLSAIDLTADAIEDVPNLNLVRRLIAHRLRTAGLIKEIVAYDLGDLARHLGREETDESLARLTAQLALNARFFSGQDVPATSVWPAAFMLIPEAYATTNIKRIHTPTGWCEVMTDDATTRASLGPSRGGSPAGTGVGISSRFVYTDQFMMEERPTLGRFAPWELYPSFSGAAIKKAAPTKKDDPDTENTTENVEAEVES